MLTLGSGQGHLTGGQIMTPRQYSMGADQGRSLLPLSRETQLKFGTSVSALFLLGVSGKLSSK